MQWYSGNIAEAIQKSKQNGAVFGVAIFGDDENSKSLEESLNHNDVQAVLVKGKFVCIRITANSEEHQQFSQIYSNAPSPSVYLLGDQGSTLEIIKSALTPSELKEKLSSAWNRHSSTLKGTAPTSAGSTSQAASSSKESSTNTAQNLVNANEAVKTAQNAVNQENLTLEEKIERAQRLAAAKRAQKLAQEAEDERQKERERREAGKGLSELKKWQDDQEAKQLVASRKKEKQEEIELRKRLKEQIAQDRAARNARTNVSFMTEGPVHPDQPTPVSSVRPTGISATPASRDYSGLARLQFRMPSGSSISHGFEPEVKLSEARNFLINNNHVAFRQFTLSIAYPRRQFTDAEYNASLRDLGLVPSATLLVLPISGSISSLSGGATGIQNWLYVIFGYLVIPFTFIFSFLQRALPSSSPPTNRPENQPPPRRIPEPRPSTSSSSVANAQGDSTSNEVRNRKSTKKGDSNDSNVHRLRNNEGDSEDEKFYNGNSTQQM